MWILIVRMVIALAVGRLVYVWAHGQFMGSFMEMGGTRTFSDYYADGGAGIWGVGAAIIAFAVTFMIVPPKEA